MQSKGHDSWLPGTVRRVANTREARVRRYRIGDVSRMLNEPAHILRHWQEEFSRWLQLDWTAKGQRLYSEQLVTNLREIQRLLRVEMYTTEGAKRQLRLAAERDGQINEST